MKTIIFLILTIICLSACSAQTQIPYRDPNADTVWYRMVQIISKDSSSWIQITADINELEGEPVCLISGRIMSDQGFVIGSLAGHRIILLSKGLPSADREVYYPDRAGIIDVSNHTAIKTSNYDVTIGDALVLMSANGAVDTAKLPAVSTMGDTPVIIKKTDSSGNAVRVQPHAGDTIEGASIANLAAQYKFIRLWGDGGTVWYIVGSN